jgi:hypothetical protein
MNMEELLNTFESAIRAQTLFNSQSSYLRLTEAQRHDLAQRVEAARRELRQATSAKESLPPVDGDARALLRIIVRQPDSTLWAMGPDVLQLVRGLRSTTQAKPGAESAATRCEHCGTDAERCQYDDETGATRCAHLDVFNAAQQPPEPGQRFILRARHWLLGEPGLSVVVESVTPPAGGRPYAVTVSANEQRMIAYWAPTLDETRRAWDRLFVPDYTQRQEG